MQSYSFDVKKTHSKKLCLIPIEELLTSSDFLVDDSCVFGLSILKADISSPEKKPIAISKKPSTYQKLFLQKKEFIEGTYSWTMDNYLDLKKSVVSPAFEVGGHSCSYWQLHVLGSIVIVLEKLFMPSTLQFAPATSTASANPNLALAPPLSFAAPLPPPFLLSTCHSPCRSPPSMKSSADASHPSLPRSVVRRLARGSSASRPSASRLSAMTSPASNPNGVQLLLPACPPHQFPRVRTLPVLLLNRLLPAAPTRLLVHLRATTLVRPGLPYPTFWMHPLPLPTGGCLRAPVA
ncbi:hypothetical protein PR202_ga00522 [Eleusine coracana subsp. coracana]|uniref:Uncharacterized protein n=1 Tax=Eleusine coracana subsp. coracana TaxID=191504 RepID=A0AAV5BEY0_ELECO|nr:hypothetical protein PR202_ga00522 [Eleusine coracana subsp. coracana]